MNNSFIARIKYIMRRVSCEDLQKLATEALKLTDGKSIRALYDAYAANQGLGKIMSSYQQEIKAIIESGEKTDNH